jgi:hypothetical protein
MSVYKEERSGVLPEPGDHTRQPPKPPYMNRLDGTTLRRYGAKIALLDENGPVMKSLDQPTHHIKKHRGYPR